MKKFILSLIKGFKQTSLNDNELEIIKELSRFKAIDIGKNFYKLKKDFCLGTVDISSKGLGFLKVLNDEKSRDLLIEEKNLNSALMGDFVIAKKSFNKRSRPQAKIIKIIQRLKATSIVFTKKINNKILGINIQNGLNHTLLATQKYLKSLPEESVLKINVETGEIIEVLGLLSDPKIDETIVLKLYEKEEFFTEKTEKEASSYGNSVDKNLYPNRLDLTHLDFCTIDPVNAKDFDDAIYFDKENLILYIAIADVSEYVIPFNSMDKEAKQRGFSIYFPHKSIPMLPRKLSENICSLKPDEDRLGFCFKIQLNEEFEVRSEALINVIICSKKRYSYDTVDEFLKKEISDIDQTDERILSWLLPLNEIIKKIRKKRLETAFEFDIEEVRMKLDKNQNLLSTRIEAQTPSHALIEDCMLLANKAAAKRIKLGIFRNHEEPDFEKVDKLLVDLEELGLSFKFLPNLPKLIKNIQESAINLNIRQDVDKLIVKSQKKAGYEHLNKGHFGLGFKQYTHFTSPIRRYSDLILHRLLKSQLNNDDKLLNYQLEDIEETCENLSVLERQSDKIEWSFMDRKFARWANDHLNEEFDAIITDINKNTIAKLDDKIKGARLFLLDQDVELLERVKVKIVTSDIASTRITAKITKRLGL